MRSQIIITISVLLLFISSCKIENVYSSNPTAEEQKMIDRKARREYYRKHMSDNIYGCYGGGLSNYYHAKSMYYSNKSLGK